MTRQTSILALVTEAFGGRGGIAQYNRDLLLALAARQDVEWVAVLPRQAPQKTALPDGIAQMPARTGRIAYSLTALRNALGRRPDIVFCGHLYMAPLAWLAARLTGAKLILQMHGIEAWPCPSRLRRAAVEAADLVLCVSRHTRARVIGWAAIAPERLLVVPNTVADAFAPGEAAALGAALRLEGKRLLLTVGRLDSRERYKGHDRVIAAIPDLLARGHDVVYLIIGEGDDRRRLEVLAQQTGVTDRVRFLGAVDRGDLVAAYRMADLFVMPSTGEGFGIAYLEAMACGTPALGLDAAGARDALAEGALGTMTSEADLPEAIARLLAAPRPDPAELSRAVHARFGHRAFAARIGMAFERLAVPA